MSSTKKKKVLIVGYGSIGKRHDEVLNEFFNVEIDLVTSQNIEDKTTFKSMDSIKKLDVYDYFILSNATNKHYITLVYILLRVSKKTILVEKPLFEKSYELNVQNNHIFVAYNLRFHPLLALLKDKINSQTVINVNIQVGQDLKSWRPESDYRKSYSAFLSEGGGVLRDLSHEIDYLQWLFGEVKGFNSISTKVSNLEIQSDDIFTAIGLTKNKTIFTLSMDYISKIPFRNIVVQTQEESYLCNMIDATINGEKINIEIDRNISYRLMHQAILENNTQDVCTYKEGLSVMKFIDKVKFKNIEEL